MSQEKAEQLIIIGNGFDLHCGLKTSFYEYLKCAFILKEGKLKTCHLINDYENLSHFQRRLSFWDVYFYRLKEFRIENWANFEKQVELLLRKEEKLHFLAKKIANYFYKALFTSPWRALNKESGNKKLILFPFNDTYKNKEFFLRERIGQDIIDFIYDSPNYLNEYIELQRGLINYVQTGNVRDFFKLYNHIVFNVLLSELKIFEDNLNEYISNLVLKSPNYSQNFLNLINDISEKRPYNVLSFNYTFYPKIKIFPNEARERPNFDDTITSQLSGYREGKEILIEKAVPQNCTNFTNIHGSIYEPVPIIKGVKNSNIVIGIDSVGIDAKDDLFRFTKTYSLLECNLFDNHCLQKGIKSIKVYGHSLSEADYSYFQSIFDFYDIYDSDVKIVFYYTDQRNRNTVKDEKGRIKVRDLRLEVEESYWEREKNKKTLVDNVIKLIEKYGETLDNKDHGRNLLHKLLLEGRLRIEYIE